MSFKRSFPEIMAGLCPMQIKKGGGGQEKTDTLMTMTFFSNKNRTKTGGVKNYPNVKMSFMDGLDKN